MVILLDKINLFPGNKSISWQMHKNNLTYQNLAIFLPNFVWCNRFKKSKPIKTGYPEQYECGSAEMKTTRK